MNDNKTPVEQLEDWRTLFFDERQRKEIAFDVIYAAQFAHGTDGHNSRLIIAKLADLLDRITAGEEVMKDA